MRAHRAPSLLSWLRKEEAACSDLGSLGSTRASTRRPTRRPSSAERLHSPTAAATSGSQIYDTVDKHERNRLKIKWPVVCTPHGVFDGRLDKHPVSWSGFTYHDFDGTFSGPDDPRRAAALRDIYEIPWVAAIGLSLSARGMSMLIYHADIHDAETHHAAWWWASAPSRRRHSKTIDIRRTGQSNTEPRPRLVRAAAHATWELRSHVRRSFDAAASSTQPNPDADAIQHRQSEPGGVGPTTRASISLRTMGRSMSAVRRHRSVLCDKGRQKSGKGHMPSVLVALRRTHEEGVA